MMLLFAGCNKEEGSVEGKWYSFDKGGPQNPSLYLELKNGKADMIITAWGDRYKGDYTYKDGTLTITYKSDGFLTRYQGSEEPEKATALDNLFNDWPGATEGDHTPLGSPIVIGFKVDGDNAVFNYEDKNGSLRFNMTRKK